MYLVIRLKVLLPALMGRFIYKMNNELKNFIEDNIDLIDGDDFTELYNRCRIENRGKLTDILYECGIDPLQHLTEIPALFAYKANITDITIPNNVTNIGVYAFQRCSELTSITFGADSQLTSISSSAFSGCSRLTSITLPNIVTIIGESVFSSCSSLTSITIPLSVTRIGDDAFKNCGNLQITYLGTKQQWKQLITGLNIFPKTTYVCNCLDGIVEKNGDNT